MNFTEAVKAVMNTKGINKADVARATGYSYQHIHDLIAGERRWNEDSINKVCDALGISVNFEFNEPEGIVQTNEQTASN
ncbi:helix-turn-helix domain-containing protein [Paenibacillus bouchesdurhonensis]|uniref:helix-turn-helix domain-containing protein n=1 Tax=Paenibacillus bouchesdurhonensis TaxID=1870990 RepID=UPI000DA63E52|nr:helix-turn-helix transcriptional regulator [Paenibacillus bouchesdurhonensis]